MLVDPAVRTRVEVLDLADLALTDDAASGLVCRLCLEVLRDAPDEALGLVRGLVLCDEGAALCDVGRDGLLAEDVLACGERLADDGGLGGDREDDDDAVGGNERERDIKGGLDAGLESDDITDVNDGCEGLAVGLLREMSDVAWRA